MLCQGPTLLEQMVSDEERSRGLDVHGPHVGVPGRGLFICYSPLYRALGPRGQLWPSSRGIMHGAKHPAVFPAQQKMSASLCSWIGQRCRPSFQECLLDSICAPHISLSHHLVCTANALAEAVCLFRRHGEATSLQIVTARLGTGCDVSQR